MRNAKLDDSQAGIEIAERSINNLRCADYTALTAESEEELKNLLTNVKEDSEKAGLKLNIQKQRSKKKKKKKNKNPPQRSQHLAPSLHGK